MLLLLQLLSLSVLCTHTHTHTFIYTYALSFDYCLCSGAGDETLRFWQVFPGPKSHDRGTANGLLFPSLPGSVVR